MTHDLVTYNSKIVPNPISYILAFVALSASQFFQIFLTVLWFSASLFIFLRRSFVTDNPGSADRPIEILEDTVDWVRAFSELSDDSDIEPKSSHPISVGELGNMEVDSSHVGDVARPSPSTVGVARNLNKDLEDMNRDILSQRRAKQSTRRAELVVTPAATSSATPSTAVPPPPSVGKAPEAAQTQTALTLAQAHPQGAQPGESSCQAAVQLATFGFAPISTPPREEIQDLTGGDERPAKEGVGAEQQSKRQRRK
ncbi:hypothetical protein COLO4_24267 [Corchorus olitorius]|uniref:Transmembrane protein n=1 Tax=Corchorus olitorius TaxID=93759 RepID=A0A1R3IBX1_9ROSI|nr:hypothetical protein COLO4_24267 [Corchorus olitorius]